MASLSINVLHAIIRLATQLSIAVTLISTAAARDSDFRVVLLGTGTPVPSSTQFGPSILVEVEGRPYVVDCGRGCGIRLGQVYGPRDYKRADTVLLTHFHSDHVVGLPELYLNGWVQQRRTPLRLLGPSGVQQLANGMQSAFAADIDLRTFEAEELENSVEGGQIEVISVSSDGLVIEEYGLTITAFSVDHGHVTPALGYRFDFDGRSVVISGDTGPSDNLTKYANGADVVIHEVMSPGLIEQLRSLYPRSAADFISSIHTSAEEAGVIFSEISPKLAVYYHTRNDESTRKSLLEETRQSYSGNLLVGEDLMVIDVGETVSWSRLQTNEDPRLESTRLQRSDP